MVSFVGIHNGGDLNGVFWKQNKHLRTRATGTDTEKTDRDRSKIKVIPRDCRPVVVVGRGYDLAVERWQ